MPGFIPRYVRCYDNGGRSFDRYTVVFGRKRIDTVTHYRAMSEHPCHTQGFGQWGESQDWIDHNKHGFAPAIGRTCHLGRRITFLELPEDCQELILADYRAFWNLGPVKP